MAQQLELLVPEIPDIGRVFDSTENEWVHGYQRCFQVVRTVKMFDNVRVDDTTTTHISSGYKTAPYARMFILIDAVPTGTPGALLVELWMSDNGSDYYYYIDVWNQPFDDNTGTGHSRYLIDLPPGPVYTRFHMKGTGAEDASNYYDVTLKIVLISGAP